MSEAGESFPCFGSMCSVYVSGRGPAGPPEQAVAAARERLLDWHAQFSRFDPASELSRLNDDPCETGTVTPMMARFLDAAATVAALTGGLVDPTLGDAIEAAGYAADLPAPALSLAAALERAPERTPAHPAAGSAWRELRVDRRAGTISRPRGLRIDSGGLAKGLFADVLDSVLGLHFAYAVDCAGDLRVGGTGRIERAIEVTSPFDGSILHVFAAADTAIATSGIGKRSWIDCHGAPAHHLLDPSTGRPAFTGIVQATALAPTGVLAEAHAKAAILSGPQGARDWLPWGGYLVRDNGRGEVVAAK